MSNTAICGVLLMKKIFYSTILLLILLVSIFGLTCFAQQLYYNDEFHYYEGEAITLEVNGSIINSMQMPPVIIEDRTMVPVRDVFEALGSKIVWHDDTCMVEIADTASSVFIKIGDRNTYVNGSLVTISSDQPYPMLIGYNKDTLKSMVPVRFVAENLGYDVKWNSKTRKVSISKPSDEETIGTTDTFPQEYGSFGSISAVKGDKYDDVFIKTLYGISPKVSRYSDPDRLVFDFEGAKFITEGGAVSLSGNVVSNVRYSNHENAARVVLDLTDLAQVSVMSSSNGIRIRAHKSVNENIIYDAFAKRIYFIDKGYSGKASSVSGGISVNISGLSLENETIDISDGFINNIQITKGSSSCTITVMSDEKLAYSSSNGFYAAGSNGNQTGGNVSGKTVVIDAGHGGYQPGALGYDSSGKVIAHESDINLAIAKYVKEGLLQNGVNVEMTREDDSYVSLADRSNLSNSIDCSMFVSIHCNSIENKSINGTQVYYHPESEEGTILANNIYNYLVELTGLAPKKTQNGANLYVIRTNEKPAVLVETAFISNASDLSYLMSTSGQKTIAEAIVKGIIKTLGEI